MKHFRIIVLIFIALSINFKAFSQNKLHAIVFVATSDHSIGNDVKVSHDLIIDFLDQVALQSNMKLEKHEFVGAEVTKQNAARVLDNVSKNVHPSDAVIFWFVGHGEGSDEGYNTPDLIFMKSITGNEITIENSSLNLTKIYDILKGKCKMTWVIGDACNSSAQGNQGKLDKDMESYNTMNANLGIGNGGNYTRFFEDGRIGDKIFMSAEKNKVSYTHQSIGALYTHAFINAFHESMNNGGIDNVNRFEKRVKRKLEKLLVDARIQNDKFFKRLFATLFSGTQGIYKKYKKAVKNNDYDELYKAILDMEEKDVKAILVKNPTIYYALKGITLEKAGMISDSTDAKVFECYCTAKSLRKTGMTPRKEKTRLRRMKELNEKNGDGLDLAGQDWATFLEGKCTKIKTDFEEEEKRWDDSTSLALDRQSILQDEIDDLREKQDNLLDIISDLDAEISQNTITVAQVQKEWEGEEITVEYQLSKIPRKVADPGCLERALQKIKRGTPLTDPCEILYGENIEAVRYESNQKRKIDARRTTNTKGYELGESCGVDIENSTEVYLNPLLVTLESVPANYKRQIEVELQIWGHADSRPCKGAGCNVVPNKTGKFNYKNNYGITQNIETVKNVPIRLTNEQLAFSRALCASKIAEGILSNYGVLPHKISYEYFAEVHDQEGGDLRGVNINYLLKNQFKHYKDQLAALNSENKRLRNALTTAKREIDKIEEEIFEKEEEILAIDDKLVDFYENLYRVQEIMEQGTEVIENLKEVWQAMYPKKSARQIQTEINQKCQNYQCL